MRTCFEVEWLYNDKLLIRKDNNWIEKYAATINNIFVLYTLQSTATYTVQLK